MKLILIIGIFLMGMLIVLPVSASMWYSDETHVVSINGLTTDNVTSNTITIIVSNGTGTSSGNLVYLGANVTRIDMGDVRFTDVNNNSYQYVFESQTGTTRTAKIVGAVSGSTFSMNVYSGSSTLTPISNAVATYINYDTFIDSSGPWSLGGGGTATYSSTGLNLTYAASKTYLRSNYNVVVNETVRAMMSTAHAGTTAFGEYFELYLSSATQQGAFFSDIVGDGDANNFDNVLAGVDNLATMGNNWTAATNGTIAISRNLSGTAYCINDVHCQFIPNGISNSAMQIYFVANSASGASLTAAWVEHMPFSTIGYGSTTFIQGSPPPAVAPVASFTTDTAYFNAGSSRTRTVTLTDTSTNTPTVWTWYLTNQTPGNATEFVAGATSVISIPLGIGNWSVKLHAGNTGGSSNSTSQIIKGISLVGLISYPADHIYNVNIQNLSIDPRTAGWVAEEVGTSHMYPLRYLYLTPVDNQQPGQFLTSILLTGQDNISIPFPKGILIQAPGDFGGDAGFNIINIDNGSIYEGYKPVQAPGSTWNATSSLYANRNNYTLRTNGASAEGASGLPYSALSATYDEVVAGKVNHALAIAMPYSNTHTWPAYANGNGDTNAPPLGERWRLNVSFNESGYTLEQRSLLDAMKTYGCFLIDQGLGGQFNILTENDVQNLPDFNFNTYWGVNGTQAVTMANMEAVDDSVLMINPNSGQTQGVGPVIASSSLSRGTVQASWYTWYNDTSTNAIGWIWTFGDGTISTTSSGSHTYYRRGIYNVSSNASSISGYNLSYSIIRVI